MDFYLRSFPSKVESNEVSYRYQKSAISEEDLNKLGMLCH